MGRFSLDSLRMWLARKIAGPLIRREVQQAFMDGCESGRRAAWADDLARADADVRRIAREMGIPGELLRDPREVRSAAKEAEAAQREYWPNLQRAARQQSIPAGTYGTTDTELQAQVQRGEARVLERL
jgi:hypothetical protein